MGCKAAIPLMAKSGGGSIVNFSSAAGNKPSPDLAAYNSAKAAVVTLTKSIALYCAREKNGVRVNSVQPGTILTPNVESVIAGTPDPDATRAAFSIAQPIGRMGEVEDIAHLVVYLASDESKFATGAPFIVDGGLSIA
jgi:3(or 17)beta-hydroxysteroid dehydrogenase